jgi:hypothetical protein
VGYSPANYDLKTVGQHKKFCRPIRVCNITVSEIPFITKLCHIKNQETAQLERRSQAGKEKEKGAKGERSSERRRKEGERGKRESWGALTRFDAGTGGEGLHPAQNPQKLLLKK